MQSETKPKTMTKRATCECGHARAEHLRGVGCCVAYAEPDAAGDDHCDCGVFRGAGDVHEDGGLSFGIATADGRASATFRTTPDAEAPLREAAFAASEHTRELFAAALTGHVDTLEPPREPTVPISRLVELEASLRNRDANIRDLQAQLTKYANESAKRGLVASVGCGSADEPAVRNSTADAELELVLSYIAKVSEEAPPSVAAHWRTCLAGLTKVLRLKMHRGRGAGSPA